MWQSVIQSIVPPDSIVYLCGSSVDGTANALSDVDAICCTKYASYIYSEHFLFMGMRFHIVYFPFYKLSDYLLWDCYSRDHIYVNMWSKAQCLNKESSELLKSMQNYTTAVRNQCVSCNDDQYYSLLTRIIELCDDLISVNNDQVLVASDLFIMLSRFLSGLLRTGSKHVGRQLVDNQYMRHLEKAFVSAIQMNRYDDFVDEVKKITSRYGSVRNTSTTGVAYNNRPAENFLIYIPDSTSKNSHETVLDDLISCCGHNCYSFRVEPNQAMAAGSYIFVPVSDKMWSGVYESVLHYHESKFDYLYNRDIKIVYPYRSVFTTGLYFGGHNIILQLSPMFSEFYFALHSDSLTRKNRMLQLLTVYKTVDESIPNGRRVLLMLNKCLESEAADPSGIYNTDLLRMIISQFNKKPMQDNLLSPLYENNRLVACLKRILLYLESIQDDEVFFPSLSLVGCSRDHLYKNVLFHLHDIMKVNYVERYMVLRMYLSNN